MCGINGFNFKDNSLAMRMRKFTKSRGPDADGIYIDNFFKSKNLLKKVFNKEIHSLVKGKWGLQSPYAKWLKGPLNTFAKEILSKEYYSNSDKYLNFENIQKMLIKHQKEYYNPALIWSLINLQLFFRKFKL